MKQGDRYPATKPIRAADPRADLRQAIRDLAAAEASATGRRLELIRRRKARLAARLGPKRA